MFAERQPTLAPALLGALVMFRQNKPAPLPYDQTPPIYADSPNSFVKVAGAVFALYLPPRLFLVFPYGKDYRRQINTLSVSP